MNEYFTSLIEEWLENESWISQITAREPIVYIAAGIFGVLLFVGFIVSILAICLVVRRHSDTYIHSREGMYQTEQKEAAKTVVSALRSSRMSETEIRDTLINQYHFDALTADSLMGGTHD